tara:strand:+ start:242 stop:760 length:519 start_codon:yes stop_codon:yes gene_type:complete
MGQFWSEERDRWLRANSLLVENSKWAENAMERVEEDFELGRANKDTSKSKNVADKFHLDRLKEEKKKLKASITNLENELDDLTLNTPNSYKLQISIPSNLNYLLKAWAAADGRDLSGIALHCLEVGLREIKGNQGIPLPVIKRYELACEKRIALAELNNVCEKVNSSIQSPN